jgi:hypothetical protein
MRIYEKGKKHYRTVKKLNNFEDKIFIQSLHHAYEYVGRILWFCLLLCSLMLEAVYFSTNLIISDRLLRDHL